MISMNSKGVSRKTITLVVMLILLVLFLTVALVFFKDVAKEAIEKLGEVFSWAIRE